MDPSLIRDQPTARPAQRWLEGRPPRLTEDSAQWSFVHALGGKEGGGLGGGGDATRRGPAGMGQGPGRDGTAGEGPRQGSGVSDRSAWQRC